MVNRQKDTSNMFGVCTYNCSGLRSNMQYLHEFLDKHHPKILCLQETWLLKCNLKKLSEIHPDYMFHGFSAMDSDKNIISGRPYGGVALLWHKSIGL